MYFRRKTSPGRAYLQIVESRREGTSVRQQVIATLGRIDELQESGQLERLLRSGARFADKAIVLDALDRGEAKVVAARHLGPALAFERLWEETGCRSVIERLAGGRKHDFSLERAAFLTVLDRLFGGGELEDRLAAASGARASWPTVIADLDSLTETEVEQDGKRFLLRSAPRPAASLARRPPARSRTDRSRRRTSSEPSLPKSAPTTSPIRDTREPRIIPL